MPKEIELWNFVADRLRRGESVMLLVVAESQGSSPGRAGYKMAVGAEGELVGSIGGGVMEVDLVERSKAALSEPSTVADGLNSSVVEQEHRKNTPHPSGMICSGEQTVIFKKLLPSDLAAVETGSAGSLMTIASDSFSVGSPEGRTQTGSAGGFEMLSKEDFIYREIIGPKNRLIIIGGGHCALALSELMSKMDFYIHIVDDRPELNTIEKNQFANDISIIAGYDEIAEHVPDGDNVYIAVMTLGYKTDAVVIRQLVGREFKYFGVLGSKAKMATLMKELIAEGVDPADLARVRTPIGLHINSRTPEEIAVSIAAEIIAVKNS